jgi:hypothetical protein
VRRAATRPMPRLASGVAAPAIIAILDPWQADTVMVGAGHAPVVAVLLPAVKAGRVHSGHQRT